MSRSAFGPCPCPSEMEATSRPFLGCARGCSPCGLLFSTPKSWILQARPSISPAKRYRLLPGSAPGDKMKIRGDMALATMGLVAQASAVESGNEELANQKERSLTYSMEMYGVLALDGQVTLESAYDPAKSKGGGFTNFSPNLPATNSNTAGTTRSGRMHRRTIKS